jgi:hypothetical protein
MIERIIAGDLSGQAHSNCPEMLLETNVPVSERIPKTLSVCIVCMLSFSYTCPIILVW